MIEKEMVFYGTKFLNNTNLELKIANALPNSIKDKSASTIW
jgi:hypothetical protein